MKFEIRLNRHGDPYVRIVARNGERLFVSESYVGMAGAMKAIRAVRRGVGGKIVDCRGKRRKVIG